MKRILGLMMAIAMLLTALPAAVYAEGVGKNDVDIAVDFVSDYLSCGENEYRVFGTNNTNSAQTVQTVRAIYNGDTLVSMDYGEPFTVAAGDEFAVKESVSIPEGTDLGNSYVNIFVWDGMNNYEPLAKQFGSMGLTFEFTVEEGGANTSAGVYTEDGTLVRMLWSAKWYDAGTYTAEWDGKDDAGEPVDNGSYVVKVLSNNVKYEQDALLANNTVRERAGTMMTSYQPISDMTLLGSNMYYADQYMENYYTLMYFNISDIHRKAGYFESRGNRVPIRNANDGEVVYWLIFETTPTGKYNEAGEYDITVYGERRCFVMGVDVSSNTQVVYENGQPLWDFWGANSASYYKSAIGYEPYYSDEGVDHYSSSSTAGYGDIAVQQEGNLLFVTYGSRDFVRVIDKTTGQTLKDNSIKKPTAIVVDGNDLLWVAYTDEEGNYAISQFSVSSDGTMTLMQSMPQSLCQGPCLALATSPDNSYITVAFGGGVGKIFAYNISDWSEKWSFGRGGDYSQDPTVYDDKFCFRDTSAGKEYTYLTFQDENYLWMGDPGNDRNYKLYVGGEGTPTIADTIWFSKQHYACEVDAADSTRIMFGPKEYKIDYSKEGDESWTLVKNYVDTIAPYVSESTGGMFYGITTMSNGRVYFGGNMKAVETTDVYGGTVGKKYIYELTETGARNTGVDITGWNVLEDGKMTLQRAADCNYNGVSGRAVYQRKFKSFDENGNPSWYDQKVVAFISDASQGWNSVDGDVAISSNGIVFPVMERASALSFRTAENPRDFRIGGFKASTDENTKWLFRVGPATTVNYARNVFPRDGHIEINAWYGLSGEAKAYDDNMIIHYRGEGLRAGQANIFYHYLDNGLLVGVFGNALNEQNTAANYGQELLNGNGFCWHMAYPPNGDGDTAYIYQGGEARMSGCVRTKVTGLNSIKITDIPVTLGNTYRSGILVRSYNGTNCGNTSEINNSVRYSFSLPEDVDGNGSAKYETYIKVPTGEEKDLSLWAYSDGNVRIVYNNEDVISGTGIIGQQIALSSDKYKKLTIYVTPNDGQLSYFELKADINGVRTDIPTKYLYAIPEQAYVGLTKYDLLEDLPFDSNVTGQTLAGWDFSGWNVGSNTVKTNVAAYDWEKGSSLSLSGSMLYGESIVATRDLGNVRYDMSSWKLSTTFTMAGEPNGYYTYTGGGSISGEQCKYIDILDVNGKIIARVTYEDDKTLKVNGVTLINTDSTRTYLDYNIIHELTVPSELEIYAYNGQLVFNYRDHSVTTGVYESGADWHSPKTLKVWAFKNYRYGPHPVPLSTDFITLNYTQYAMDEPCVVKFYAEDKTTLLGTSVVEKGDAAKAPDAHKGGYILSWSEDISKIQSNMEVYAIYTKDETYYTVSFYDENSNLLSVQQGQYGTTISYDAPIKNGYAFMYWMDEDGNQVDLTNRQKNLTVYPKYRKLIDATETFDDLASRIIARVPYRYTNNNRTAIGAMTVNESWLPAEGYGIESYTKNDDGTYSNVVLKTPMYSQLQGSTGFSDEYIYARANNDVSTSSAFGLLNMAGKDGNTSKVMLFNGTNTMLNYNKFRAYFDGVDDEDKVEVSFDFKVASYSGAYSEADTSAGGFGDIIDTSYDSWSYPPTSMGVTGNGRIVKARCDSTYGYAIWDSENEEWVTLVSSSDSNAKAWNSVKYVLDMTNQTFTVYLNGTNKGTYAFANPASTVNAVEFNLMRNNYSNGYYIDNIKVQNNR